MSWKSLVTASLLCVLASPAFAAPSLSITSGGLDASGNWIWNVTITPTATGTPLATELGFTTNGALKSVANAAPATWDTNTPGNPIFSPTWETTYGSPLKPEGIEANCASCTVTNVAASGGNAVTVVPGALNQIFAALGSIDLASGAATQYLTIKTAGPTSSALTTSVTLSGSYSGSGHIAEITTGSNPTNYKGFTGVATRTVKLGDINLDGTVNFLDGGILASNFNAAGVKNWNQGDFNGDGTVNFLDGGLLASNFNTTGGSNTPLTATGVVDTPGAGAGLGSAAVPEPASIALLGLALLGGMGLVGRKR